MEASIGRHEGKARLCAHDRHPDDTIRAPSEAETGDRVLLSARGDDDSSDWHRRVRGRLAFSMKLWVPTDSGTHS